MKIVHIAPNSPYNDYWGYQENLLPKYQRKIGHDVVLITTTKMHKDGEIVEGEEKEYTLSDGVKVVRKAYKNFKNRTMTGVLTYIPVYTLLNKIKPDFIFYHGLVSYTIVDVVKYKKENKKCIIVEDNHMDYNIGNASNTLKEKVIRAWLRLLNKYSIRYVSKVYGVTPWRKTYAEDYFKIPKSKTDVLIMGADDDNVDLNNKTNIRMQIRNSLKINEDDFLIVTGGKIDEKKKIDVLIEACTKTTLNLKLLVFGSISGSIKKKFDNLISHENIIYIGWIDSTLVYNYFFAADLVFFPGQHSVLWEQACAAKVPCVFERWPGMEHVNNGGNSKFVSPITIENICETLEELCYTSKYYEMKRIAESDATDVYLYSKIADKSLEAINASEK